MKFRICDVHPGDVYGDVDEGNFIWQRVEKMEKPLNKMAVGDGQTCTFRASGTKGTYRVIRLS